jgi:hypothetical protein
MNDTTIIWTIDDSDGATTLTLRQADTITFSEFTVPVWQVADRSENMSAYPGRFVREMDMPADLAEAFAKSQLSAQIPFRGAAYDYDFQHFISRVAE